MEFCSRCKGELDTTGSPRWCKKCRNDYQQDYQATRKAMTEGKGFAAGVQAMRQYLAENFRRYGSQGAFTGDEIAQTIINVKGPSPA